MTKIAEKTLELLRWSIEDYHKLGETSILDNSTRVELINGQIIKRSPIGSGHSACVEILDEELYYHYNQILK